MNLTLSNIKLNGHLQTLAKSVTYLRTDIDETLSWNNQIEVLAKNFAELTEFSLNLDITFQSKTLISIYYSLFQS